VLSAGDHAACFVKISARAGTVTMLAANLRLRIQGQPKECRLAVTMKSSPTVRGPLYRQVSMRTFGAAFTFSAFWLALGCGAGSDARSNGQAGASGAPASGDAGGAGALSQAGSRSVAGDAANGGGSNSGGSTAVGGAVSGATSSGGTPALGGTSGMGGAGPVPPGPTLAFPGAQGFGRLAVGGRNGEVYHVTTLADAGPGSLRDAISQPNRIVVFDVGGVIQLSSRLIFKNNQTIAGQTAPGGGITLYGDGTSFSGASHTIVRYVRFRMGKVGESGKDTVTMANGHDVIWDHCSLSWGRDGTFDLNQESGAELYNLTLQDSIVAQGLQTHSTGGLVQTTGTTIVRSLYIDNNSRNPKARGKLQFVNNVVYNWVTSAYILGDTAGRSDGAMVGNYLIAGPETDDGALNSPTPAYNMYARDNYYDSNRNGVLDGTLLTQSDFGSATWLAAPSVEFPEVPVLPAAEAYAAVRDHAGASRWRDAADDYVVNELESLGTKGKTISDELSLGLRDAVGEVAGGAPPLDTDRDGMPDAWESAAGLDSSDATDGKQDQNGDGWTNVEQYIHSLAR
jgi:pectate lyase